MPFYPKLRINKSDSSAMKSKKIRTATRIKELKSALEKQINPEDGVSNTQNSVRIATWNIREFGNKKYLGRSFEELYYIAEIISHFHFIALQEIRTDLKELKNLMQILGQDWSFIATDVTDGDAGNGERMVFLYNRRIVQFRNIAGELTLPEDQKIRAAFGERIKLNKGLSLKLPEGVDLSGTYKAQVATNSAGKKKLKEDLEIPIPRGSVLELPEGMFLTVVKNTGIESLERGKVSVSIPNIIQETQFRLKFPENTFDDSLKQFARSPFLISFQTGWLKLNLCTVHIYYGDDNPQKLEQRRKEIELLARSLANKARTEFKYDKESFLGVLGDFNIIGKNHPTMAALESNGFEIPEKLKKIPGSNVEKDKAYDQIAFWKPDIAPEYAILDIVGANVFDYYEYIFTLEDEETYRKEYGEATEEIANNVLNNGLKPQTKYKDWRTYKMSDHLPMWIELRNDFSREYLDKILINEDNL